MSFSRDCLSVHFKEKKNSLSLAKASFLPVAARSASNKNFEVLYTLSGIHRVKLVPEDSSILKAFDSILSLQTTNTFRAHYDTYRIMDSLKIPHPDYIRNLMWEMDLAKKFYVNESGFREPEGYEYSFYYANRKYPAKYPIEVVDLGTIVTENFPELKGGSFYALTHTNQLIQFDNDFMYYNLQDSLVPIKSEYYETSPPIIKDYTIEWKAGLKVTATHEYFHAVQFSYVKNFPEHPHLWYEASATGMEEILAPLVNDYLQYLPSYFKYQFHAGLMEPAIVPGAHYGASIFFNYLYKEIGMDFHKYLWEVLGDGKDLKSAITSALNKFKIAKPSLWVKFFSSMVYNQNMENSLFPPISEDQHMWPVIPRIHFGESDSLVEISLPPLSFEIVSFQQNKTKNVSAYSPNPKSLSLISLYKTSSQEYSSPPKYASLKMSASSEKLEYFLIGNWSLTDTSWITLSSQNQITPNMPLNQQKIAAENASNSRSVPVYNVLGQSLRLENFPSTHQVKVRELR